jgi:Lysyl oxidase
MHHRVGVIGGIAALVVLLLAATMSMTGPSPAPSPSPAPPTEPTARTSKSPKAAPEPSGPPELLPNMRSLGARDLRIQGTGADRLLRFSASLANLGPGPLTLLPERRGRCAAGEHSARQVVHIDRTRDGTYQRARDRRRTERFSGCMLRHQGHDHWHFDAMAAYSLRRPEVARPLVDRNKVSFCLRDNVRVPGRRTTVRREHFGDCTATAAQGISPGWVDIYTWDLDGQTLRVPPGIDGETVCLHLAADPRDLIEETTDADNAASVPLRIQGTTVRRVPGPRCAEG